MYYADTLFICYKTALTCLSYTLARTTVTVYILK